MKRGGAGMSENKNAKGMPRPGSRSSEDKPVGVPGTCARWHIYQPEKPLPARVYQQCRQCQQIRDLLGKRPHARLRPGRASVKRGGASRPGVGTEDGNAKPRPWRHSEPSPTGGQAHLPGGHFWESRRVEKRPPPGPFGPGLPLFFCQLPQTYVC